MELLVIMLVCGLIGWAIGKEKGRPLEGFLWGAVLGLIGIIIIAIRRPAWTCPTCGNLLPSAKAPCASCVTTAQNMAILAAAQAIVANQSKNLI